MVSFPFLSFQSSPLLILATLSSPLHGHYLPLLLHLHLSPHSIFFSFQTSPLLILTTPSSPRLSRMSPSFPLSLSMALPFPCSTQSPLPFLLLPVLSFHIPLPFPFRYVVHSPPFPFLSPLPKPFCTFSQVRLAAPGSRSSRRNPRSSRQLQSPKKDHSALVNAP